jgi:Regulator of ribonuclease activity B
MSFYNTFWNKLYRFFTREEMQEGIAMQPELSKTLFGLFRKYGGKKQYSGVEFFFYADAEDKAANLAIALHQLNYSVYGVFPPSESMKDWSITGITPPIPFSEKEMTAWCETMYKLGYEFDCKFDGWGTLIE